jgi:transposase
MQAKRRWLPSWQRVELVELCLERGLTRRQAAAWRRVSVSTVQYWIDRFRAADAADRRSGGWAQDCPSTPHCQPARVDEATHDRVCAARRRTGWGPRLIASELGMSHATVSRCLQRRGPSRMPKPERGEVCRYEWPCPGDLLQMDTKQFQNFTRPGHAVTGDRHRTGAEKRMNVGKQFAHSMIDDHSRLAYTELHGDERALTVTAFVARALAFFASHGIRPKSLADSATPASPSCCSIAAYSIAGPAAHPQAQRQGRALPTNPQARVGARADLQKLNRPRRRPPRLAHPLQHHPKPQLPSQPAAHHPRSERPEARHLAAGSVWTRGAPASRIPRSRPLASTSEGGTTCATPSPARRSPQA